ncbi:MAG: hypothetical protein WAR37_01630 [Candidatus Microsaccharimonas sp.]
MRFLHFFRHHLFESVLIVVILALIIARFGILTVSPPGFYIDETASGAQATAMVETGKSYQGVAWPGYVPAYGGGFTTPVYLYPLTAWASLFGTSEYALRSFSQFVTILSVIIIGLAFALWYGRKSALLVIAAGLALPWNWLQGSLAWDPVLVPLMASLVFLGWTLLYRHPNKLLFSIGLIVLPVSLLLIAYSYPPYWVSAPLLTLAAYGSLWYFRKLSIRAVLISFAAMALLALPLLAFILSPGTLGRSSSVSIFSQSSLLYAPLLFLWNCLTLANPIYWFVFGDVNMRQSTGFQGMLGIAALIPLIVAIIISVRPKVKLLQGDLKTSRLLLWVALIGYALSSVGAALTAEGQPHSLRSCGAWVFALIAIGVGWHILTSQVRFKKVMIVAIILFFVGTVTYAIDLAVTYPSRAALSFDSRQRGEIHSHKPVRYPGMSLDYYKHSDSNLWKK